MKKKIVTYAFLGFMMLVLCSETYGQDPQPSAFDWIDNPADKEKSSMEGSPFSQGNWNFQLRKNISYSSFSNDNNDWNDLDINLKTRYFIANGLGVGVSLGYDNSSQKNDFSTSKTSEYEVLGGLTYGLSFGEFNLFAEAWGGIGKTKDTYSNAGFPETEQETDILKLKGALGSPIRLGDGSAFLTPKIGYQHYRYTDSEIDDYERIRSGLFLNMKFDFYLGCDDMFCGYDDDYDDGRYEQGANHLVFPSFGQAFLGKDKESYGDDGEEFNGEESIVEYRITLSDYQYILNNLAVGLSGSLRGAAYEEEGSGYQVTSSSYYLMPMVRANLPVGGCMNNLYAEAGYGFGGSKIETDFGSTTSEAKQDLTVLKAGIGYNYFVHTNLALVLGVHYQQEKLKDDADNEDKSSGIVASFGTLMRF